MPNSPDPTAEHLDSPLRLPLALGFLAAAEGGIELRFHPQRAMPWTTIGLTADYLGSCAARMAGRPPPFGESFARLANELLENAFKYRHPDHPDPVAVRLGPVQGGVVLEVSHPVGIEQAQRLIAAVHRALESDPQAMFLEQTGQLNGMESGLGLWTLAQEPDTRIGWRLEALGGEAVRVASLLFVVAGSAVIDR